MIFILIEKGIFYIINSADLSRVKHVLNYYTSTVSEVVWNIEIDEFPEYLDNYKYIMWNIDIDPDNISIIYPDSNLESIPFNI